MELNEIIKGRRSIRRYQDKNIPDHVVEELLDLARYAPSSMNGQPWCFIVIKKDETKDHLKDIKNKYCSREKQSYKADFLQGAPVVIVVCVNKHESYSREIENGVLAATNIMLIAYNKDLGSVFMTAYRKDEPKLSEEIKHILGIPEYIDPIAIIPLGYPNEIVEPKELRSLEGMIHYERF